MVESSDDAQTSAQELLQRGRRWLWLTFLPLLCMVLLLAAWQAWAQWRRVPAAPRGELLLALVPQVLPFGLIALGLLAVWASTRTAWVQVVMSTFAQLRMSTQREQRAEALKSAIVDHAQAALMVADENGRVVEFNPAAEALTGYRREQALGKTMVELLIPERFQERFAWGLRQMGDGDRAGLMGRRLPRVVRRADGSELPVEVVMWMTRVDGTVFFTASVADLTDVRAAAEVIERQRDALRQSEKLTAMGSLLAGVAHELNNPLAIVMGRASLLEEKTEGTPLQADAARIRDAAERCGRIVRTFLNMARSRPAQRGPVDLNALVRATAELLQYRLRTQRIDIALALAEDLPTLSADGDQIGQIVLNLLVNAQQAMALVTGPRRLRLETTIEAARDGCPTSLSLRIADTGPGVPADLRTRIFESFFTTKPEGTGTGLGLAVSRSIARAHGGDLVLDTPGDARGAGGATFRLSLPIVADDALPPLPLALPLPWASDKGQAHVLVVDDEPALALVMREMLGSAGHAVTIADSGTMALTLLADSACDVVVFDLHMPDMDGIQLWTTIGRRYPALARRMIAITGDTLSSEVRVFLRDSACPSLEKPFDKAALLEAVAQRLRQSTGAATDQGANA